MIRLEGITVRIQGRVLLEDTTVQLQDGHRYGLVGRNGTGKSTLLKLLTGELEPDAGRIEMPTKAVIGSVAQEAPGGNATPLETVLAADTERESLLAERASASDPMRQADIEQRLLEIGADAAPSRAARILNGLGFDEAMQSQPLSAFSGGWRMRVALAAVLFGEPDILLLDEPTNHLDLEAAFWLTGYLQRYPRTLLLVSHDRDLLNDVPTGILHLAQNRLELYRGNYDRFERTKAERQEREVKMAEKQAAQRAKMQAFVDRFRAKATKARQAQSRLKMLSKMADGGPIYVEPDVIFELPEIEPPPPPLLSLDRVTVGYDRKPVLRGLDLRLDPEDRIALLGANGNGKSTLAKLLAGRLTPMEGQITPARQLRIGFFAQHQIEDLHPNQSALEHLQARKPKATHQAVRGELARFGLDATKVTTPAKSLSGGEKARLCLALLCAENPQILILDEPTNHLDIDSREALVAAINAFAGAVVLISHDSRLIEMTADQLWLVRNGKVERFDGDLDDYRTLLRDGGAAPKRAAAAPKERSAPKVTAERRVDANKRRRALVPLRKALKEAEQELAGLERRKKELTGLLGAPETFQDGERVTRVTVELAEVEAAVALAEARWLELGNQIEEMSA